MKSWPMTLILVLAIAVLAGCGGEQATPTPEPVGLGLGGRDAYTSSVLDTSYPNALDVSGQLVLGILRLEETENAVTPKQATALLPLWQALRGGVTAQAEVNAVLKQMEGTMTPEQLSAIAAMQLTQDDLRAWMEEQGLGMGPGPGQGGGGQEMSPDGRATRQAEFAGGEMPPEMATRRAQFESMSEEDLAALRATAQAGGGMPGGPGSRGGTGGGEFIILLNPLIELLEARAGER
jgi:hypothetical protein